MTEEIFQPEPSNILDLHNFRFEDVEALLEEFIWSCNRKGIKDGIIIHGKGTGRQRDLVHQILESNSNITYYKLDGENWGKTLFSLSLTD